MGGFEEGGRGVWGGGVMGEPVGHPELGWGIGRAP